METMVISTSFLSGTITAKNGAEYEAVYDNFILEETATTQKIIVSFQKHTYGKYAVIRNFKEQKEI